MTKDVFPKGSMLLHDKLATLGMLSAGLVHEINNPLAYVLANLRFLNREIFDLKTQLSNGTKSVEDAKPLLSEWTEVLTESVEGVQHIGKLVKDIRGFARSDTQQEEEWFVLQEVVEASLRMVWSELKHRVSLEKRFEPILPCLWGNPSQIQQIFINLLMNAAQAIDTLSKASGKLELVLFREGEGVCAVVRDNGRGIPPEHMDKLFEPFFTTKPFGEGTGLGLTICRQLVSRHGGRLHLESQLGKGTSAHVWLPVQKPAL